MGSRLHLQAARVHSEMIELERHVSEISPYVRPLFGGDNPSLRDALFRAGAAWIISYAVLLAAVTWIPR